LGVSSQILREKESIKAAHKSVGTGVFVPENFLKYGIQFSTFLFTLTVMKSFV